MAYWPYYEEWWHKPKTLPENTKFEIKYEYTGYTPLPEKKCKEQYVVEPEYLYISFESETPKEADDIFCAFQQSVIKNRLLPVDARELVGGYVTMIYRYKTDPYMELELTMKPDKDFVKVYVYLHGEPETMKDIKSILFWAKDFIFWYPKFPTSMILGWSNIVPLTVWERISPETEKEVKVEFPWGEEAIWSLKLERYRVEVKTGTALDQEWPFDRRIRAIDEMYNLLVSFLNENCLFPELPEKKEEEENA